MSDTTTNGPKPRLPHEDHDDAKPIIESSSLFCGRREILIRHDGEMYRLLITRNGKLILNK